MKAARASIRYAKAFLEFAIENQKEKSVIEEMKNILSLVESSPQLDEALNSPIYLALKKERSSTKSFLKHLKLFRAFLIFYHKMLGKEFLVE